MKSFKEKVIVITGAGSGIGRALAVSFAKNGAFLALSDVNEKGLEETKDLCKNTSVFTSVFNVSKKEEFQKFAKAVVDAFGTVDIVINNAGVALGKSKLIDLTYEEFEWLMGINFWGVVYGTKEFLPYLIDKKEAAIVNISSLFGLAGIAEQVPYCASKFAVRGLSESLRMELMDTNVKVHSVHPGGIKTNIANNARVTSKADAKEAKSTLEKFNETALIHTPEMAANVIIKGIKSKQEKIMIGYETYIADTIIRAMPEKYTKLFGAIMKQQMG
jgi:NADP-dependent 3-hydroxy acid dehydrogenase YdfG